MLSINDFFVNLLGIISGILGEPIDVRGKLTDIDRWDDHIL